MRDLIHDERGTTSIEYALIASMMTMVLAGVVGTLREGVQQMFEVFTALTEDPAP
ncbi:MAG: Flp family type IVb pilin [Myxococcales bacterium]|nr:Flp family type IVb pilin [Myxococcales bacterium]